MAVADYAVIGDLGSDRARDQRRDRAPPRGLRRAVPACPRARRWNLATPWRGLTGDRGADPRRSQVMEWTETSSFGHGRAIMTPSRSLVARSIGRLNALARLHPQRLRARRGRCSGCVRRRVARPSRAARSRSLRRLAEPAPRPGLPERHGDGIVAARRFEISARDRRHRRPPTPRPRSRTPTCSSVGFAA